MFSWMLGQWQQEEDKGESEDGLNDCGDGGQSLGTQGGTVQQ